MQKTQKITIPFPNPKPATNAAYKLTYAKPSNINVVGCYPLQMMTEGDHVTAVDLVVTMPTSIFQEKDYLNYRYFYKRAYYLACLAAGLQSEVGGLFEMKYAYFRGNTLQPILSLVPKRSKF
jgi:U3 small nucleolar RNA-associated protein 22